MKIIRITSHVLGYDLPETLGLFAAILHETNGSFG